MKQLHKVILLPVRKLTNLYLINGELGYGKDASRSKCNLYIISNEEVKEWDWVIQYDIYDNKLYQFNLTKHGAVKGYCNKIIATTDDRLTVIKRGAMLGNNGIVNSLPSISEAFIKEYITRYNAGSPITQVMVEYKKVFSSNGKIWKTTKNKYDEQLITKEVLRLNNNEVIIFLPEKKLYTIDEVEELIVNFTTHTRETVRNYILENS